MRHAPAVLLALAFAAACGPPAPAGPPVVVARPQATGFNGTDIAWLQLMIPMNEQALLLVELVPARTSDRATRHLADLVGAALRSELDQLRALRARAGVPSTNLHEGHDMPGLLTAEDLRAAEHARGAELGRLVTARLREHLEQGVLLCRGERVSGADPATTTLAAAIERARPAQLAELAD